MIVKNQPEVQIEKTEKEIEIFNNYRHWLKTDEPIPSYVVTNYNQELKAFKDSKRQKV